MENRNFAGNLQISKVNKWYPGDVHAVKDMDMEIKRGPTNTINSPLFISISISLTA